MAFDDPVVWLLIIAMAIVLFGTSRIPQLARAIGQSKREYENGARGVVPTQQVNDTLLLKSHDKNSP